MFPDRYHAQIIRTPRQARHALAYVLNNWRKHGESKLASRQGLADRSVLERAEFSWLEGCRREARSAGHPTYEPLPVWEPKTWLLREGWKKHGLISSKEIPSQKTSAKEMVIAE